MPVRFRKSQASGSEDWPWNEKGNVTQWHVWGTLADGPLVLQEKRTGNRWFRKKQSWNEEEASERFYHALGHDPSTHFDIESAGIEYGHATLDVLFWPGQPYLHFVKEKSEYASNPPLASPLQAAHTAWGWACEY